MRCYFSLFCFLAHSAVSSFLFTRSSSSSSSIIISNEFGVFCCFVHLFVHAALCHFDDVQLHENYYTHTYMQGKWLIFGLTAVFCVFFIIVSKHCHSIEMLETIFGHFLLFRFVLMSLFIIAHFMNHDH